MILFSFQFLYGTIKRKKPRRNKDLAKYFNSSMVQLKVNVRALGAVGLSYFNSSMVQLKEPLLILKKKALSYFNSSMVQLKV